MTNGTDERLEAFEKGLSSLQQTVGNLRALEEANAQAIKLIAEGHGAKLDSISATLSSHSGRLNEVMTALEPLQQIKDFIERVADEHELRITALEKHTNLCQ